MSRVTQDNLEQTRKKRSESQAYSVNYSVSDGFVAFLKQKKISLAATSYQSGRLYLLGWNPKGGLMVNEEYFKKAMGLHVSGSSLYMATLNHLVRLENILEDGQWLSKQYTSCFVPRVVHLTGQLDTHDIGVTAEGKIVFANTKYNCIATTSERHSFKPIWAPKFISDVSAGDRCHLNGIAMENGEVAFATAVSRSDTVDGWRDHRISGGVVIDVRTNEVICEGLSMPHSPRVHDGRLWVANSGCGQIGWVDLRAKQFCALTFCPGYVRGLAFHGDYIFVGLSKPRYARFEGLELDDSLRKMNAEPWTGIQVIHAKTGALVHWFRIDGVVSELYDVAVLPNVVCGKSISLYDKNLGALLTVDVDGSHHEAG